MKNQDTCHLCGKPTLPFENRLHVQCDQREYALSEMQQFVVNDSETMVYLSPTSEANNTYDSSTR